MATPEFTTFRAYYEHSPDPYAANPGALLQAYVPNNDPTPTACRNQSANDRYPMLFLGMSNQQPKPRLAVIPEPTLPGILPTTYYALQGDVTDGGNLPPVIRFETDLFHLTPHVWSLPEDAVQAAFDAAAPGALLPAQQAPQAGNNPENLVQLRSRRTMPVPHPYCQAVLRAHMEGALTPAWVWANICEPIRADPQQAQAYHQFVVYCQVAFTLAPAGGGGNAGVAGPSVAEFPVPVHDIPGAHLDHLRQKVCLHLPGLRAAAGLGRQVQLAQALQQQLAQQQQQQPQAAQTAIETPQKAYYRERSLAVSEVLDTNDPEFSQLHHVICSTKNAEAHGAMLGCFSVAATQYELLMPQVDPTFTAEMARADYTAATASDVMRGLSIFRICPASGRNSERILFHSRVFSVQALASGRVDTQLYYDILAAEGICVPDTNEDFRGIIEGYAVVLISIAGTASRATQRYRTQVIARLDSIVRLINQRYQGGDRVLIWLKIMYFIFIVTNNYLDQLLARQARLRPGMVPPPMPESPDYSDIEQYLLAGRANLLVELPATVANAMGPARPAPQQQQQQQQRSQQRAPAASDSSTGRGNTPAAGGQNTIVTRPNQNQRLRQAWAALGHSNLYTPGSPFHDSSQPRNRRLVLSDTRGQDGQPLRICLPMALTGKCYSGCQGKHDPLSREEEQRVATAGGFTLE